MSPSGVKPPKPRRTVAELVGGGFVVWAFVWENARQALGDVTNPTLILPVPRATRLVEVFVLVALLACVVIAHRTRRFEWAAAMTMLVLGVVVTVGSSLIGILAGYTTVSTALNTSYAYLSPLMLAGVVSALSREWDEPTQFLRIFEILVVLNSIVAWYQFGIQGAWGDAVHGALHDAHMYANVAWIGVLLVLVRLYYTRRGWWRSAVLLFLFAPTAWAAQHEMAEVVLGVVILGAAFLMLWHRGLKWRLLATASYVTACVSLFSAIQGGAPFLSSFGRIERVITNLPALGIVEGYAQIPSVITTAPHSLLIGTSPGSYGSPSAIQSALAGSEPAPLVRLYTVESYELNEATRGLLGSFVQKSTDLTVMLVEFGPFVLLCGAVALWLLVIRPALTAVNSASVSRRIAGLWVTLSSAYMLLLSAGTAFYGWSASHASVFPIVVTGALLAHRRSPGVERARAEDFTSL